jgi:hypothetical protein
MSSWAEKSKADRAEHYARLERDISSVLEKLRAELRPEISERALGFVQHGEFGLAYETVRGAIDSGTLEIDPTILAELANIAAQMGLE